MWWSVRAIQTGPFFLAVWTQDSDLVTIFLPSTGDLFCQPAKFRPSAGQLLSVNWRTSTGPLGQLLCQLATSTGPLATPLTPCASPPSAPGPSKPTPRHLRVDIDISWPRPCRRSGHPAQPCRIRLHIYIDNACPFLPVTGHSTTSHASLDIYIDPVISIHVPFASYWLPNMPHRSKTPSANWRSLHAGWSTGQLPSTPKSPRRLVNWSAPTPSNCAPRSPSPRPLAVRTQPPRSRPPTGQPPLLHPGGPLWARGTFAPPTPPPRASTASTPRPHRPGPSPTPAGSRSPADKRAATSDPRCPATKGSPLARHACATWPGGMFAFHFP